MSLVAQLEREIAASISVLYGAELPEGSLQLERTKKEFRGHYTLVVFPFLKLSRKKPEATAEEIGQYLVAHSQLVSHYEVIKGFLNLVVKAEYWLKALEEMAETPLYGHTLVAEDSPFVMVEYSSPNTNKPLHLGHIRNNLLGYSLSLILEANGKRVFKTNIVNDRGIHICKSMIAWQKWGDGVTPEKAQKKGDHLVGDFYVLFDKHYKAELKELMAKGLSEEEAEKASPLMQETRRLLKLWEEGDPETLALWRKMNAWVYEGFDETYRRLGVSFDKIYYESETYLEGKGEVLRGLEEGKFYREADGSVWADLSGEGLDKKLLLRADGTSVYITQDIGTAKLRYEDHPIDEMVYVVGNEQNYHFQILSLLLDCLGYKFGKELVHFSYGMVELPEGKMKSREGTVVDADDLMDEMIQTAATIASEQGKAAEMTEEEALEVARIVGLGALKYFILKVDPKKNMTFNPKESIDFNGNTGAFIQYTYARIRSLLGKAEAQGYPVSLAKGLAPNEKEQELIQTLLGYKEVLQEAARLYSPALIANYVYDLVREYNQYYHDYSVLREENAAIRSMRLYLSRLVAEIIKDGMSLLGIEMPERM